MTVPGDTRERVVGVSRGLAKRHHLALEPVGHIPQMRPSASCSGFAVAHLVDDELPVPAFRRRGAEVFEIECEDGQAVALGNRHDGRICEPEAELGEARIERNCASQEPGGEECRRVFAVRERREEEPRGVRSDTRAQELIDLDYHRIGHEQIAPELRYELGRQCVRGVAPVDRRQQGSRIGDDPQRTSTSSRR